MQREDIEVSPGLYWTDRLPLVINGDPATDLTDYEFQLQVRDFSGNLLGTGTVEVSDSNLLLSIPPSTIAAMADAISISIQQGAEALSHWQQKGALVDAINACTTVAEVQAIDISFTVNTESI